MKTVIIKICFGILLTMTACIKPKTSLIYKILITRLFFFITVQEIMSGMEILIKTNISLLKIECAWFPDL